MQNVRESARCVNRELESDRLAQITGTPSPLIKKVSDVVDSQKLKRKIHKQKRESNYCELFHLPEDEHLISQYNKCSMKWMRKLFEGTVYVSTNFLCFCTPSNTDTNIELKVMIREVS